MAVGWSREGAIQKQIDASVAAAVKQARSQLPGGESSTLCEDCHQVIPQKRREAIVGVRLCVACQTDAEQQGMTGTRRRFVR